MGLRKKVLSFGNFNENLLRKRLNKTEDSDGLTQEQTLSNRGSSGTKAHFIGTLPINALRDGLTWGQNGIKRQLASNVTGPYI